MGRRRQTEKDEVLIDLVETKDSAQGFLEKNQFKVLGGIGLLALLIGALVAYFLLFKSPRESKAMSAMFKAEQQFERDSFALALENPGGGFDGFLDIIDNYNGTKAANLAKYYAGISYLNLGLYDPAIEYLNGFSAKGDLLPITKLGALGDAYSEKGDFDQALSYYQKAANTASNELLTPYYLKKLALLSDKQGNKEDATNFFNRIKEEFPDSEEGSQIDKYLARY
jgi:tetratricopeptide (TPR) repeat protein